VSVVRPEATGESAIVFGAGLVGRGFLGQLLTESGYEVVFVDIDRELVDAINARHGYGLRLVDGEETQVLWIEPVSAVDGGDADRVTAQLCGAGLAATAVGARALRDIAPVFAQSIKARAESGQDLPLNVIVCENVKNAATIFREMVRSELDPGYRPYLEQHVGFVMAVIGRMVPLTSQEMREENRAFVIAEPYRDLPVSRDGFVGSIPAIIGLHAETHFDAWVARKLYLHNAGHAMLAYLGYLKGLTFGYEALHDADVRPLLEQALCESKDALMRGYGLAEAELCDHVTELSRRFDNRALADSIFRLARDPLRKLGPEDRLVGAARFALQQGIVPEGLAWGIAAGLAYDDPRDRRAIELQGLVESEGVDGVLGTLCGLEPSSRQSKRLIDLVIARYTALSQGTFRL
jgi:mannitol-1-phosphate 5-dehydrogenase